ncbi:ABC transporter permease [Bacillus pseudomycoides]|uniref:ABC transporter permease n=1 Tax=Bacillus pseudomycoides TaxID=64104 RepID=UPI000BF0CB18|nr:ABC transporter permease [Bacillus pseudomycoides]PEI52189.1 ABC transporter permease [Bacillus pseudomycoides]PEJ30941.1 ABC transporter permease [Bacillus pseudomycoides]PHA81795.1 ABC transporter permease [Bacillus pseudomycoides]PHC66005.1 ABC transporter permease [Bacillus pseudomycoides]
MLVKLSMSGLKSKLKDYIVLLVGLVMSISIFYMFQTLALNEVFLKSNATISSIGIVFQAGSILLAIITFFYILYANSFLLSLRQKEFGMYMMLGAKKHKITLLMFMETIIIGVASLVIGIAIGVGLAQGIGQLLMKQLEFTADGYQAFYVPSMTVTCIFFFVLFVFSAIMNSIKLSRITVLQLVHANAQTDRVSVKGAKTVIFAVLGIILLAIGYAAMIYMDKLQTNGIFIALFTVTPGTYLLFGTFLPLIIKKLKSNKKRTEKGLNAFTFAQLNFRINSLTKVLATVAMLVALGAGAISGGMAFKNNVMGTVDGFEIYDSVVHNPTAEEKKILNGITFKEKSEYRYKVDDKFVYYLKEDLEKNRPFVRDINNMKGMKDLAKVKKASEELPVGAISSSSQEKSDHVIPKEWEDAFRTLEPFYVHPDRTIKIVDQKMYESLKGTEGTVFIGKTDDFLTYSKEWKKLDELQLIKYKNVHSSEISKYAMYTEFYNFTVGTVFMGFFLGIAFLAMMASCLMFKILSGASSDITRYQMLRKIGVRRELLTKSIYKELFLVFLFPAIVGIVHVLVGMKIFSLFLIDPYFRIWLPILIFVVIYAIYYFITVQLYKGIVLPKED